MKRLIAVIFLLAGTICYSQNPVTAKTYDDLNDKYFIPLQLEDTSGNIFSTATLTGKTLYVDFWFTTCAPCLRQIPYAKNLEEYFKNDTNVVFLNICVDNIERKADWKQMIRDKQMAGIHLFYARNRPQKINLLREYRLTYPTYLLVNKNMRVIGYNAPRPSEEGYVHFAITNAKANILLSETYRQVVTGSKEYKTFIERNIATIKNLNEAESN